MPLQGGPYKIGQQFGPFTLQSYLGGGAFKSVYQAQYAPSPAAHGTVAIDLPPIVALGFPYEQNPGGIAELRKGSRSSAGFAAADCRLFLSAVISAPKSSASPSARKFCRSSTC